MKYQIVYMPEADEHLRDLPAFERAEVLHEVEKRLSDHPLTVSKNCREMRRNVLAEWRLRLGTARVFSIFLTVKKRCSSRQLGLRSEIEL
ncbi:MAG TPA: hypothetical protein VKX17_08820 [Planctomycetota bacterium]|nr:hypothetical protein [Planctomycetota bacterium]